MAPGDHTYLIRDKTVHSFILQHPTGTDLRKVVQVKFLDLMTNALVQSK